MQNAPLNTVGWTKHTSWSDLSTSLTLEEQLKKRGVLFEIVNVPHLVGWAGCASLIFYTSPVTALAVTVLVVPHRGDIDSWSEDYYYFEGMTREVALANEQLWLDRYDLCNKLLQQQLSCG